MMEELKITRERAIRRMEWILKHEIYCSDKLSHAAINMAITALRSTEPENKALTLEQVKQLKPGTPVIIVCNDKLENIKNFGINFELNYWGDGDIADGTIKVYARKPEGSEKL